MVDSKKEKLDVMNQIRKGLEEAAIKSIKSMSLQEFKDKISLIQTSSEFQRGVEKEEREQKMKKERQQLRDEGKDYLFRCGYCDIFVVCSDAIKVINDNHHIVIDSEFQSKAFIKDAKEPWSRGGWAQKGQVLCKACRRQWGQLCTYQAKEHYVLKITCFEVVTPDSTRICYKAWKECPFYMETFKPGVHLPENDD